MFQGGIAQTALDLYPSIFPDSGIVRVEKYIEGEPGPIGTIKMAVFTLCGRELMCADSPIEHEFSFTPPSSTFMELDTAVEGERVFSILAAGKDVLMPLDNYGFNQKFGWVNDRFGVSWQINLGA
ncbi:MAG: VOC family protein [Pseudomonadota bacterium]